MFKQDRLIAAVDFKILHDLKIHDAYEKYCGFLSLEDVFTSDHVAICAKRCASGFMDKKDTRHYMKAWQYNSYLLSKEILAGKYRPKYYRTREILERGKKRLIRPPVFVCKVVQKVLCDYVIRPLLTPKMISTSYASVTGRGTDKMYADIEKGLNALIKEGKPRMLVITDYSGYFASIPHDGLRECFNRYVIDIRITGLIMLFCKNDEGLSLGNEVSQVPASFYPSTVDHWVKDKNRVPYWRYMDDGLSAVRKGTEKRYVEEFRKRSEAAGLTLKDSKIQFIPLGQEFVFCKEHFYIDRRTGLYYRMINGRRIRTEIRKIRAVRKSPDYSEEAEKKLSEQYKSVLGSIKKNPHTYRIIEKLDKVFREEKKKMIELLEAQTETVEIRGCEKKTGKNGEYLLIRVDTPSNTTGETASVVDWDILRQPEYVKGRRGKLKLLCKAGRCVYSAAGFIPEEMG